MPVLVIDAGTSSVRAVVFDADGAVTHEDHREVLPASPAPGLVEFDPAALAAAALALARDAVAATGGVDAVGIANQRSSTVAWDRATGEVAGPGLGWQDQRTMARCERLLAAGHLIAPNLTATKAAWLLERADGDGAAAGARDLCVGTVDSWLAWTLSDGARHVTDATNVSSTGLGSAAGDEWDDDLLALCGVPRRALPEIVASSAVVGTADALPGAPPIAGIAGDQQASLIGQGCTEAGLAKITFGTGGMLDLCVGTTRPAVDAVGPHGCVPLVAWRDPGATWWMLEAVMLAAGANVEWLRDGLGIIDRVADAHEVAAGCETTEGVTYVPALLGLGTPHWDFDARGTFLGISRGTTRAHIVRAVLEGVAHRAADLVEAAEADSGLRIDALRVDGGMTANATFVQAVADATGLPVDIAAVPEATALGAALLAGRAVGVWERLDDLGAVRAPRRVEPRGVLDRGTWSEACQRARHLSANEEDHP